VHEHIVLQQFELRLHLSERGTDGRRDGRLIDPRSVLSFFESLEDSKRGITQRIVVT